MKFVGIAILISILSGCSSSSIPKIQYYLLTPANTQPDQRFAPSKLDVRLKRVIVADYLNSRNLVMQINEHQLYYSKSHLWAEDLHKGFAKALVSQLNYHNSKYHFIDWVSPLKQPPEFDLVIRLDHFMATDDSQVVLSGQYWLYKEAEPDNFILSHPFNYNQVITADGYPQAVKQLRELIDVLSQDVIEQLQSAEKP